jgi:cysteine-rich repeat protein
VKKNRFFFLFLIILFGAAGWLAPHLLQAAPLTANEMFGGEASDFAETAGLPGGNLVLIIANFIRIVMGFLGVAAVVVIIYAGYLWATAGGEETKLEKAKKTLKNAVIGLVIVIFSFAIAQFVLSALTGTVGGGTTTSSDGSGGGDVPADARRYFYLRETNIGDCAESIQNLVLSFSFSQKVDLADLEGGISITKGGEDVEGTFAAVDGSTDSARSVTFTPSQTCTADDGSTVYCFEAAAAYEVEISSSLESSSGYSIQCSLEGYPCSFDFVTGTGFDLAAPSLFEITSPDDGDSVYGGETVVLQAHAVDDVGVASVSFYLDDELLATIGESALADYFDSEWDTDGYVTSEEYDISAEGADCAGNEADDEISVTLRPASCHDGELSEGEEEVDCGGECGACDGDSCSSDDDCSSGACTDGLCVADVEIDEVSPGDGAAGNLITISGSGFGESEGSVVFLGDTTTETDDVSHSAFTSAECSTSWSDDEVIIQVNGAAVSGPIKLVTSDGDYDRTDDDNGPAISDFEINSTVRPGLCSLTPSSGPPGDSVTVGGVNFDDSRGDSSFYFDSYEATSYENWSDVSFEAASPLLDDGTVETQLFVGSGDEREGSNGLDFTISSTTSEEPPVISQVISSITRCSDSSDTCVEAADCGAGATCDDDDSAGPSGQYITIYGSNFGSAVGSVRFQDPSTEYEALGDTSFPDECEGATWSDEQIVIKVPDSYDVSGSGDLTAATHRLWVVRASDGEESETVDFEILNGQAAPGVCALEPDSGPAGTIVALYGENFGSDTGTVEFYDGIETDTPTTWNDETAEVVAPGNAETGPVYLLRHSDHLESNPVNFRFGVCDEDFSCAADESCCSDGTCSAECAAVEAVSHYAYYFSTGDIPEAPEILTQCDSEAISPTPWERWEGGSDVCLNAALGASFTEEMAPETFSSSGFLVEKCSDDDCSSTEEVAMSSTWESVSAIGFTWLPAADWEAGTRYRVTVYGGDEGVFTSQDGLTMFEDAEWEFATSDDGDECELGGVIVSPGDYTATIKDEAIAYSAGAVSDRYECEELACSNYDWSFSSSDESKADVESEAGCGASIVPYEETGDDGPVLIYAEPSGYTLSDYGLLVIAFTDPRIESYWPTCQTACLNAAIGATFNIAMNREDLEGEGGAALYSCQDAGCTADELTEVELDSVSYDEDALTLSLVPAGDLTSDTPYRVVIDGEVESSSGSPLSSAAGDLAWEGDVSWTFLTKEETCLVDRVENEPAEATVNYVGAVQRFTAVPYGSPDNCSAAGQRLTASDYDWRPWTSSDEEVAYLFDNGEIEVSYELPEGCSASCLNEGSSAPTAICGNGEIEDGEDCDSTEGCSTSCLKEGSSTTCGDNVLDDSEECDDGNTDNGDGCSSVCLNEGAASPNSICGNGRVEHSVVYGGEDCDESEGCSSQCLNTGSEAAGTATCGNGEIEDGEDCDGTTGCSASCLNEGSAATCGDGDDSDPGEDCDDGNTADGDGCSSSCLYEGSNENYDDPSVCGDGLWGTGEECEVESGGSFNTAPFALAIIPDTAPSVVLDNEEGSASSTITSAEAVSGEQGEGVLTLECSCEADSNCDTSGESYGCGEASCCFVRPLFLASEPANESGVCRNTAVWLEFDQTMEAAAIEAAGTISLEYVEDATGAAITQNTCPSSYNAVTTAYLGDNLFARAWGWFKNNLLSIFGARADTFVGCFVQVSLENMASADGAKVYLNFNNALEAGGTYLLAAAGESDGDPLDNVVEGAVSANGVGLYEPVAVTFTVGDDICSLDIVEVEDSGNIEAAGNEFIDPSPDLFTASGEVHALTAAAYHRHGASLEEIQSTVSYSWTWSWLSNEADSDDESNIITVTDVDNEETEAEAAGLEGTEIATATAAVTDASGETETTSTVTGTVSLKAFLCENSWPASGVFEDTDEAATTFDLSSPYSNFSFSYCRDTDEDELLPELTVVQAPAAPGGTDIFKEILFLVEDTSDAIGVRVLPNEEYYSPTAWYEAEGFTGSPSETTVDGYEAVKDGNTYYVSAANYSPSSELVYSNIYVISFNEDAGEEATEIVEQVLENWSFNVEENSRGDLEISDLNICRSGSNYIQVDDEYVSCASNKDCQDEVGATYPSVFCDAEKGKLARNLRRLTDAREIAAAVSDYGEDNKHCSVTKNQSCATDDSCPGDETCLSEVPAIQSGTFLSAFTTSAWPSWSAELGNALETALPIDPLNTFVDCPEGADENYCWETASGTFECHEGSYAYIYQSSGGEEFTLSIQLESQNGDWLYDLDDDADDNATLYAEYANGDYLADGFTDDGFFCDGSAIGASTRCGDGVQGTSETCEIGDTTTTTTACADGELTLACLDDGGACRYQTASEAEAAGAECIPFECGNGVVDAASEECDDGSMNGEYGYCGENCTLSGAWYCGDGSVAGGEECDCGSDSEAMADGSWSSLADNCEAPNGQYTSNYEASCAYDCSFPGTTCGDGEINGSESCDSETDAWSGQTCGAADDYAPCSTDADCQETDCGDGYAACPISSICNGGTYDNQACSTGCAGGACDSAFTYQLSRYRTCNDDGASADCSWNGWGECLGGTQICGNGNVEGDEECDDGNDDNTDDCTSECLDSVCGDGYIYTDHESCDDGEENGAVCAPDYSSTCSYCNTSCQLTVVSGSYCGDGVAQSGEYCDGDDLPMYCFGAAVNPDDRYVYTEIDCSDDPDICSRYGFTCESVGVCDGGYTASVSYFYNGAPCAADGTSSAELCGTTDAGTCAVPICQDDCGQTCPTDYEETSILIQTELAGASEQTEADLYSYLSGDSPDTATLYLPACSVGTAITADIDTTDLIPPSIDIVFVTDLSGSMQWGVNTTSRAAEGSRRIDYVVESMLGAIEDLFSAYDGTSGEMRIATVSFSQGEDAPVDINGDDDVDDSDSCLGDGRSWVDVGFTSDEDDFNDATSGIESYLDRADGGTPAAAGLQCALNLLTDESSAEVKIVIFFSDGQPNYLLNGDYDSSFEEAAEEIYDIIHAHDTASTFATEGVEAYTAALTSDDDLISRMAHFSNDECDCGGADLTDGADDCSPDDFVEYAYAASSTEELEEMYQSIIDSILGVSAGLIASVNGTATETSGTVLAGDDMTLPFPDGFNCDETNEWTIPFRLSFNGSGTVNVSDIKLSYCPSESAVGAAGLVVDHDVDDDGVNDDGYDGEYDNCPDDPNTDQADADSDGIGDACDDSTSSSSASSSSTGGVEVGCGNDEIDSGEYCDGTASAYYCFKDSADSSERALYYCGENADDCGCISGYDETSGGEVGLCSGGSDDGELCNGDDDCSGGDCEYEDCDADCGGSSLSDWITNVQCGDGDVDGEESCDTTAFSEIYCVKGASNPDLRDIERTDCSDASSCSCSSGYTATAADDLGICNGGTRRTVFGTYDYTDALCQPGLSLTAWNCGATSRIWGTTAGTCVANTCESDCSSSSVKDQFFGP